MAYGLKASSCDPLMQVRGWKYQSERPTAHNMTLNCQKYSFHFI